MQYRKQPFFSVVIPTYNRAHTICAAIDSVLRQNFKDFEIIVIDDGSNDDTKAVVQRYPENIVKYRYCAHFGGPARARNVGIRAGRADWICFLDSDDWWYPEKLEKVYQLIQSEDVDLFYHPLDIFAAEGTRKRGRTPVKVFDQPIIRSLLLDLDSAFIPNSSVVVKKQRLEEIGYISEDRDLIALEDLDAWTRLAEITDRFRLVSQSLGGYRVGTENLLSYGVTRVDGLKKLSNRRLQNASWKVSGRDRKRIKSFLQYQYGRAYQNEGKFKQARSHYLASLLNRGSFKVQLKAGFGIISSNMRLKI